MGNQQGKQSKRAAHGQTYPFAEPEKKSRTDWTAESHAPPIPPPRLSSKTGATSPRNFYPTNNYAYVHRQELDDTLPLITLNGVPLAPGRPVVQLSSRTEPQDENSVTDEINITWAVPKDDGGFPITGYKIEMLDIQTNNWIEITFIEGFEPRCTLSNILYGIMYRFRVIAHNDAGPSEPGDPSEPVVIDVPGVQIAPYFVLMLNDTIALEHEKVEFKVKVLGTPKPTIQWFKDDMEVFSSDRLEIKEEEDGGSVIVREARLNDSGNIKCVATNVLGRATSVAQLIIEASPRLDIPESYNDGLIFRYDEVIRLKIPLIAKPPPRITWFFDDEPICPSEDVQIETTDTQTSLRIGAAKRWHCGEFRVLAQNENGEDAASILVTVTAPPSPAGRPVVIDITGTTCILRWDPIQDDGGADIKHYIVEYFRDVWDVWLKAKTTKDCQVNIEDLIPGSRYKFRIKAENAYGISEESEESDPFDVGGVQPQDVRNPTISISEDASSWSDVASSPPPTLAATKGAWESEEATEDVLNNLLRVKKLSQRVSSIESDGLPSMASIDVGDDDLSMMSESSDLQRARKMYADLQAMSMESAGGSREDMPDLDAYAREFYNEIRALSMDTGGSIENILDNIGASSESLTSLIPHDKRQELASFEMSLKQMIDEAKMLAESPGQSMEDISMRRQSDTKAPVIEMDERRSRKSFSQISQPDSVVSVIEAPAFEEEEPLPMSRRGVPKKISPHVMEVQPTISYKLEEQDSLEEQAPPPPLEELEPPPAPPVRTSPSKVTPQPSAPGKRGQVMNREPSVGSDRYEEIIVETRKRSQSRTGSRMGSRTSSVLDFKSSQNDFKTSNASIGKLDLESIRTSTRNVSALDLDNKIIASKIIQPKPPTPESVKMPHTPEVSKSPAPIIPKVTVKAPASRSPPKLALDGNQNATVPSLPVVPPLPRKPVELDPLVKMFPKNIPHWFVITYTYSVVLIMILLIANVTPDGKLYIHFTAFWSLILYFVLEDDQASDLLDTVVEGFLKK